MPDSSGESPGQHFGPYVVLTSGLIIMLVVMNVLILQFNDPNRTLGTHFYVAAGDSISFGFQPTGSFFSGFADDLARDLNHDEVVLKQTGKQAVEINLVNYACPKETTTTMINGACPERNFVKVPYICSSQPTCSQLDAVVNFLTEHRGKVSPVTFELGANDVINDFDVNSCSVPDQTTADAHLATMDTNLTKVDQSNPDNATDSNNGILPRLVDALRVAPALPPPAPPGQVRLAGDLVLLNYYNPYAKACPSSAQFIHTLNEHLANDAALFHIPVVDVYAAFGGDANMAANVCTYTWFCDAPHGNDIHPTTAGYQVINAAVEQVLGYPNPLPLQAAQIGQPGTAAAYRRTPSGPFAE